MRAELWHLFTTCCYFCYSTSPRSTVSYCFPGFPGALPGLLLLLLEIASIHCLVLHNSAGLRRKRPADGVGRVADGPHAARVMHRGIGSGALAGTEPTYHRVRPAPHSQSSRISCGVPAGTCARTITSALCPLPSPTTDTRSPRTCRQTRLKTN